MTSPPPSSATAQLASPGVTTPVSSRRSQSGTAVTPSTAASPGVADSSLLADTKTALRDLQDEFSTYRREKGENEK